MQVGRHGGGRGHGLRQPEMKGKLRTLGEAAEQDQQQRGRVARVGLNNRAQAHHLAQFIGAGNLAKQYKAAQHRKPPAASNGQRHARAFAGVGAVLPIAHQQERRNAGQLPEHDQQQQVVRQRNAQHCGHEQHQRAVELADGVILAEVEVRVQDDQQSDAGDQERKHQRQAIKPQAQIQADFGHPGNEVVPHLAAHDRGCLPQ